MNKYQLVEYLPAQWREWFLKSIEIETITTEDYAYVRCDKKRGLVLGINPRAFANFTDSQKQTLLMHEMAHIIRGDVFKSGDNENLQIWNMAWDMIINSHMSEADVKSLGGLLYSDWYKKLGLPKYLTSVSEHEIYRKLLEMHQGSTEELKSLLENLRGLLNDVRESASLGDLPPEIRVQVYQSLLEAKELAKQLGLEIKIAGSNIIGRTETIQIKTAKAVAKIEALFKLCVQHGRRFIKKRSYRREGLTEGLRGLSRKRIGKIFLLCDVSGSVSSIIDDILGMAQWLIVKRYVIEFATFSSLFHVYPILPRNHFEIEGLGGGTEIKEAMAFMSKRDYDMAVIITDGEIFDYKPTLSQSCPFPIVWLLTSKNSKLEIPKKDYVLYMEK